MPYQQLLRSLALILFLFAAGCSGGSDAQPAGSSENSASEDSATDPGGLYPAADTFCGSLVELGTTIRETGDNDVATLEAQAQAVRSRIPSDANEVLPLYFDAFGEVTRVRAAGSSQAETLVAVKAWAAQDHVLASAYIATECSPVGPLRDDDDYNIKLQAVIVEGMDIRDAIEATGDQIDEINE